MENFFLFNLKARSNVAGWWGSRVFTLDSFRGCSRPVGGASGDYPHAPTVNAVVRED